MEAAAANLGRATSSEPDDRGQRCSRTECNPPREALAHGFSILLSPSANLALPNDFAEVGGGTDFPWADLRAWMLRNDFDRVVQIAGLEDQDAAELFFGLCKRPVRYDDATVRIPQGCRGFRRLQRFAALEIAVGAELIVVLATAVHHFLLVGFGRGGERFGIIVSETDVFHKIDRLADTVLGPV